MRTFAPLLRPAAVAFLLLALSACAPNPASTPTPFESSSATKIEVRVLSAKWCPVCHKVPAMLEKLRREFPTVEFREFDTDDPANAKLPLEYQADALPYFVVLADGKLIGRVRGLMEPDDFSAYLRKAMAGGRNK